MKAIYAKYPKAFALAVVLHVVIIGAMVFNFDWSTTSDKTSPPVNVVKATAVDEKAIEAELNKIRAADEKKKREEEERVKRLEDKAEQARKQREDEQTQIAELEKTKKRELEAKAKAESERKKLEEDNRKAEAERKRSEELAAKAKEEAQRALETQQRLEEEKARERMMAEEEKLLKAQDSKKSRAEVARYKNQIDQKIRSRWAEPPNAKVGTSCVVALRIVPSTGTVLSVKITRSSGDAVFDRSVRAAVEKAQPLPTLKDPSLAAQASDIELTFRKE